MPADLERYKKYLAEVDERMRSISFEAGLDRFRAKVVEMARLGLLDPSTQRETVQQIARLMNPEFARFAGQVINQYDELVQIANQYYQSIGEDVYRQMHRIQAIEEVNAARLGAYNKATNKRIGKEVQGALIEGVDHNELSKRLLKITKLTQAQAETLGKTQVKGYSNALKTEKARTADISYFEYVGILFNDTREFCRAILGHTFHIDDIRGMQNGQISPVWVYRGGYNCRHDWEPDPDAKKASYETGQWIEKGGGKYKTKYFKPTGKGRPMPTAEADNLRIIKEPGKVKSLRKIRSYNNIEDALYNEEKEIRSRETEKFILIDNEGSVVFQKTGGRSHINFTKEEAKLFKDHIGTHNHPIDKSFSLDDIRTAYNTNMSEIRCVGRRYRHSMKRPIAGWGNRKDLTTTYQKHDNDIYRKLWNQILEGKITQDRSNKIHAHEVWTRVSKDLNIEYKRENWNDND